MNIRYWVNRAIGHQLSPEQIAECQRGGADQTFPLGSFHEVRCFSTDDSLVVRTTQTKTGGGEWIVTEKDYTIEGLLRKRTRLVHVDGVDFPSTTVYEPPGVLFGSAYEDTAEAKQTLFG